MEETMNTIDTSPSKTLQSPIAIAFYFSAFVILLHFVSITRFDYFRDEFYYLACADHLSFGYVDHPPISILILKIIRSLLGESLVAIRLLPVIGSGLFVLLAGLLAREMGGKKTAVALACTAAIAPVGNFILFHFYSMNFIDMIFWEVIIFIVLRIINTENPKYWILFGIATGLGLENKISILFLGFGIFVGLLLTKERNYFRSPYLWIGGGISLILFTPYILWNIVHGWPTLQFMENATRFKMASVSPFQFFINQIIYNNPVSLLIWIPGLLYFFFHSDGKKYRLFGWMYLAIYILFTVQQAKDYYLAGIYPVLFAGGALFWEKWITRKQRSYITPILITFILIPTLLIAPVCLPILSIKTTIKLTKILGLTQHSSENHRLTVLPQHYADMFGWRQMVEKVAKAYNSLSPQEKNSCIIYGDNYGVAGAIRLFGKKYSLPTAYSGHNSYFYWPPPLDFQPQVIIIIGGDKKDHEESLESVIQVDETDNDYAIPHENHKPIYIGRGLKKSLKQIWPTVGFFI